MVCAASGGDIVGGEVVMVAILSAVQQKIESVGECRRAIKETVEYRR